MVIEEKLTVHSTRPKPHRSYAMPYIYRIGIGPTNGIANKMKTSTERKNEKETQVVINGGIVEVVDRSLLTVEKKWN